MPSLTTERPTLVLCWPYLRWGGAQVYFASIVRQAAATFNVAIVMPHGSSREVVDLVKKAGAEVEYVDCALDEDPAPTIRRKFQRVYRRVHAELALLRHIKRFDRSRSVVHVDIAPWQSWLFLIALSRRCAGVFVTMHNALEPVAAWRTAVWVSRFRALSMLPRIHFFAANEHAAKNLRSWLGRGKNHRVILTRVGIDLGEVKTAEAMVGRTRSRKRIDIPESAFVVLCAGQFIDRKGRWIYLQAAKECVEARDGFVFCWITPAEPSHAELSRMSGYGLGDRFRLINSASLGDHTGLLAMMATSDIFTLPSFVEGLPIALLEAMAMGVPSVATRVYAIPEAIRDEDTGLLIPPGNHRALSAAILRLYDDPELRSRLAHAGRRYVKDNFDAAAGARAAVQAYEECLKP